MGETVNTVEIPTKSKFSFVPKTDEEKAHLQVLESLLIDKRRGDWKLVGEMLSISAGSAEKSFFRVYQKNHFESVNALQTVIESRKNLLKQ
ncbi:hypothetical protein NZ698_00345 [Chryseobacterium sp. PBS4-4]|uniref:Uncharacterized protein n=1 Tax=Chryseobacterium edaphi TaxID=2976532 RepID=A0ABT2W138_9FLAO|nr:hypothetical protein [Chryseobacterium edaphi]MCU7615629.1 hypothetical protein [Chryseobacterium edaphi]